MLTEPLVAVIIAVPFATEVTSPPPDVTVAMAEFDVAQVTVAPDITVPPVPVTVAVKVTVSPADVKVFSLGESVTEEAT